MFLSCRGCNKEKELEDFPNKKGRKFGKDSLCKDCFNTKQRHYYKTNPKWKESKLKVIKQRKKEIRSFLQEYKSSNPCKDCGLFWPYYVMDFDHLFDKSFVLAAAIGRCFSNERIKEEINKCDLVCSNCHRVRTHSRKLLK